jgi:hypothetical protein
MRENRDQVRQTKFNEKVLRRTTPIATGPVTLARWQDGSKISSRLGELCTCTRRLLRCITKRQVLADAHGLRTTSAKQDVTTRSVELWTAALSY